ncbi:hypothetical protein RND81_07G207300 [Saponaria officinalis]|uniref:Protein kinase domain-containing protein n=1 Tax=Saponaria officinalis TaxID=3572 RepID=A0AAW1JSS0_SAPOF
MRKAIYLEMWKISAWFCLISTYANGFPHIKYSYMLMESASSPSPTSSSPSSPIQLKRVSLSIFLGLVSGFIIAVLVAAIIRCFVHYVNTTPILNGPVVFSPKIEPATLKLALHNQNQLLVSTPNGTYFRTALDNGLTIAVKRLHPFQTNNLRKLQQHLELLAKLRHRHLMSLRAYVRDSDTFSLIYDYMPTGSLEDAMNRVRHNHLHMPWDVRLRVAVGIIKALKFLHFECCPPVLHYNLKPGNVMLDAEFEPKLADFGLAKLMPNLYRSPNGYTPPDYSHSCRYTDKSDVFSFGVILAVLLTGRDPLDPFFGEASSGGSLGRWLRHMQQAGEARQALDKSNLGQDNEEDEMLMAVRIAVVCMSELPEDRPSSDELVPMLSRLHSF